MMDPGISIISSRACRRSVLKSPHSPSNRHAIVGTAIYPSGFLVLITWYAAD
ncbi:hypothetical protein CC78DRAFT_29582 [Lojkania enalia]|uniref:Uncharacterized protein n=1 Tax=Lojkania enalia TaxID=147567 RepID=A0A9P4N659_9PLEO|nr:hypothetical protein CC78DRAFT_29582 [Didymosphaeria enalia]